MRVGGAVVVAALLVSGLLAGCSSTPTLRSDEVESAIVAGLKAQFPKRDYAAACPAEIPAESGGMFTCELTSADGSQATVTVTQTDAEGDIRWQVTAVGDAVASASESPSPAPSASG